MPRTIKKAISMTPFIRKVSSMNKGLITASLLGISVVLSTLVPLVPSAIAADQLPGSAQGFDEPRFVRMGLDKSIVVRLPAEAKDVVVGNPDVVDAVVRTKNTAYLFARKIGQTNIFFFDAAGEKILEMNLEVTLDVTAVRKLINRTIPGNRITVDTVGNQVILGGTARNALEVKRAVDLANLITGSSTDKNTTVNTMVVEGEDQVMLKVKVVEIQRNVLKQFGVDFSALLDLGKIAFKLASVPTGFSNGVLNAASGAKTGYASGGTQIETLIRAMESDGVIRTLAEPNLTALTGQEAKFVAGGEVAIRVPCDNNSSSTNCVVYKEYGVQVQFSPTVMSEDRIILKIATNVSEPSGGGDFSKRSTETVLELPSGGTMMIAGLIKESTRNAIDGTPGLKKLPILGQLFRSQDFISNETELVVFVTPILVRPTSQSKLTSPDKGFMPSSDKQSVFMGRLNRIYGGSADGPEGAYQGNVGFIVE
jgi:pilus assembly protein CpaC